MFGFFLLSCSVLATLRGTLFNNIWWVIVVTALATSIGLAVAVLADRSRGENVAKSLIFLPMAISFIGAGIIWRFMYQPAQQDEAADRRAQRAVGLARRGQQLGVEDHGRRDPAAPRCSRC